MKCIAPSPALGYGLLLVFGALTSVVIYGSQYLYQGCNTKNSTVVPKSRVEFVRANKDTLNNLLVTNYLATFHGLDSVKETYHRIFRRSLISTGGNFEEYLSENNNRSAKIKGDSVSLYYHGNLEEVFPIR